MFVTIDGFENYSVDENGTIINNRTGRVLKQAVYPGRGTSYKYVFLYNASGRKQFLVHRLVALAFIPNPYGYPQVNHIDENSLNNHFSNLEWCDAKYNINYGTRRERQSAMMSGSGNPFYGKKHSEETKKRLSDIHRGKPSNHRKKVIVDGNIMYESLTECASHLGISLSQVCSIIHGRRRSEHTIEYMEAA